MLTVIAQMTARAGKEKEVKEILLKMVEATHAEKGCIDYDLHISGENPAKFVFYENWTDKSALDEHLQTPHLKDFAAKADDLLDEPVSITLWERLNVPKPAQQGL